jgi:hypothetical protein
MKIYIHHYYNKSIFYKLAHNTTNRIFDIKDNNEGSIFCEYNNVEFEFIFKQEMSFEEDGIHILDYFAAFSYGKNDPKIGAILPDMHYMERETQQILKIFINLLKNCPKNQKWIITYFRTEKILQTKDVDYFDEKWLEIESLISQLSQHHVITDNFFLNESIKQQYPNFYYALTNTIFQWNTNWNVRWYYEFKQIYDKLNFDYDLMYSIKNHKINRINIINELSKLKNDKLYLQHTNALQNQAYEKHSPKITHIKTNSIYGEIDFDDISYIANHQGYMDVFFRVLPKSKMQILCESWSWSDRDFTSQYLSEKTLSLLLASIPFVSTHNYPLDIVQSMLGVRPHPFYKESKEFRANPKMFASFIKDFLYNFDENYRLCKEWSDLVHSKLMYKIENENSLLDLIIDGGLKKEFIIKKSII